MFVEMKEARLRALKHKSGADSVHDDIRRNERSPFEGIETIQLYVLIISSKGR